MVRAEFLTEGGRVCGFSISGHSGYAEDGSDIVCAAVTSAVRLTEAALNTVLGLGVDFSVDGENAAIRCRVPDTLSPSQQEQCQASMAALLVYLSELKEEYPDNINVVER